MMRVGKVRSMKERLLALTDVDYAKPKLTDLAEFCMDAFRDIYRGVGKITLDQLSEYNKSHINPKKHEVLCHYFTDEELELMYIEWKLTKE